MNKPIPTQSFKPLLSRDEVKVIAKPAIDIASPVLQETINYATHAFERCRTSKKGSLEEAFPLLASYLHIIQMTDSIEVLISNSCGAPADLLLRSSWEAKLAIEYILEKRNGKTMGGASYYCNRCKPRFLCSTDNQGVGGSNPRPPFLSF